MVFSRPLEVTLKISITTSNIRFENERDQNHNWPHRRMALAKIISRLAPDILCTQEGRRPQLYDLSGLLPHHQIIDSHRQWLEERMYPCIFVNPLTIEIVESGDIWLSQTPSLAGSSSFDSSFPRLFTWIKAIHRESMRSFFCVNTHLDHVLPETRREQIEVLIQQCLKIYNHNSIFFLTGDFNEGPDQYVHSRLREAWPKLNDPWINLSKKEESSFHKFGPIPENGRRIDWILHSDQVRPVEIEMCKESIDGIYPSDHFPVNATFQIFTPTSLPS